MRYTTIVVAAFLALASGISGAPIDARTTKPKAPKNPGIVVANSGNGGDGGYNFALPIAISDASSKTGSVKYGQVSTGSSAENYVGQNANGGDGSAVGSYGSGNHFYARGNKGSGINVAPVVDPSIVVLSGNGGSGGINLAVPVALSGASSKTGFLKGGIVNTGSTAGNGVSQNANGGDGSAVGSYGSHNWFGKREEELEERGEGIEERTYKAPKAPSVLVYGSGNGGNGGENVAIPIAISGAKSSTGGVKWGKVITESSAGNGVEQNANGGDGSAVGSYGSGNHFGARTYKAPKAPSGIAVIGSGNGGDGGQNYAIPIAISGAKSDTWGVKGGKITTGSSAYNGVKQNADGGDGSAVGSYGSDNHFEARTYKAPKAPAGIAVIGSGNGGDGGTNFAVPVAVSGASSKTGWIKGGKVITESGAGNEVYQNANGGDGSAVGSYGDNNHFYV